MAAMMPRSFLCNRWNVLLLAGALAPLTLQADVIFSNLIGTPPTSSLEIDGNFEDRPAGAEAAEAFTPTANFSMTDAEVLYDGGYLPLFSLFLYSNNSGEPGSMIEVLALELGGYSSTYSLVTANSFTPIDLTAGTEYWLVMAPGTPFSETGWDGGGSSLVPEASSIALGTPAWTIGSANAEFQIDGTLITPEPSTLPLASVAVLGLLIAAHRTRKRRA
jgi:hypothetical protein